MYDLRKKLITAVLICILTFTLFACNKGSGDGARYTITFDSNGGSAVQSILLGERDEVIFPPNPTRDGYTFSGWFFDGDKFQNQLKKDTFSTNPLTGDLTVYAKWRHNSEVPAPIDPGITLPDPVFSLTFTTNGGSYIETKTGGKINEEPVTKKAEHLFLGWYDNSALTGERITFPYTLTKNTTFYAKWSVEKTYIREGAYAVMGKYPQTLVTDAEVLTALGSVAAVNGVITYGGNEYVKCDGASNIDIGTLFSDGTLAERGKAYYFKVEPIKWIKITDTNGKAILTTEKVLDARQFSSDKSGWADSAIRTYLNGAWLTQNFTTTGVSALISKINGAVADKAYLLSVNETLNLSNKKCYATDYAIARGIRLSGGVCSWWLRDNGSVSGRMKAIFTDGSAADIDPIDMRIGVRPAVTVDYYYVLNFNGEKVKAFYGEKITLPTPSFNVGETFLGWYSSPDFSGSPLSSPFSVTKDAAFYAKII